MLNQAKFSIAHEVERENRSFRYTSDEKVKTIKFVKNVFQGYEIKPITGDYFKYKFEVICPSGEVLDKFYTKLNAKKAIFEEVKNA
jgi:gamma-glutamylcysteine synthetase